MSIPHPPLTVVAALMAMCATSLAHAAENSGIRLIYERMPTATTTDLKVTTPTGDSTTSGSGDLDSHMRVGLQMRHFNDAQPVATVASCSIWCPNIGSKGERRVGCTR